MREGEYPPPPATNLIALYAREWAQDNGIEVPDWGPVPTAIIEAWEKAGSH